MTRSILVKLSVLVTVISFSYHIYASSIHEAVVQDDLKQVREIISKDKGQLQAVDQNEATPLHYAAREGNFDMMRLLYVKGAEVEAQDNDNLRPLHHATSQGHLEVVKYLIEEAKAEVEAKDNAGRRPLHYAVGKGHLGVVKYLVEDARADVDAKDEEGCCLLHYAAGKGNLEVVKYLVEETKAEVDAQENHGHRPLRQAATQGHLEVVKYLLIAGADEQETLRSGMPEEIISYLDGWPEKQQLRSLLFNAIEQGKISDIAQSLRSGADINAWRCAKRENGKRMFDTVLHQVVLQDRVNDELVKALIQWGADVNAQNSDGDTPLHLVIKKYNASNNKEGIRESCRRIAINFIKNNADTAILNYKGDSAIVLNTAFWLSLLNY